MDLRLPVEGGRQRSWRNLASLTQLREETSKRRSARKARLYADEGRDQLRQGAGLVPLTSHNRLSKGQVRREKDSGIPFRVALRVFARCAYQEPVKFEDSWTSQRVRFHPGGKREKGNQQANTHSDDPIFSKIGVDPNAGRDEQRKSERRACYVCQPALHRGSAEEQDQHDEN